MPKKIERTIRELYSDDPERADAVVFGRRGLLKGAGLAAMGAAVGGAIPFAANMPAGLFPAALAQDKPAAPPAAAPATAAPPSAAPKGPQFLKFPGKDEGLVVLGDRPLVAETPEHLLDDDTTPTAKFFVRNNGQIPTESKDGDAWKFAIEGEVNKKLELTVGELKSRFKDKTKTFRMVLECGGNGRVGFSPPARGNQWANGGAGCAEWTGIPLSVVLKEAGVKPSAVYTANYGRDLHLSGDEKQDVISRGVPIKKAMDEHTMLVFAMNGQPLSNIHGGPLRVIAPGYPGSASHKWLSRIVLRDKVHDGQGMLGTSYRTTIKPMVPGGKPDDANMRILESMPVRGIVTNPANGTKLPAGTRSIALRGAAWDGEHGVKTVDVSLDFGATWKPVKVSATRNKYDWRRWTYSLALPGDGYYEIWVRATDTRGVAQPHIAGDWNPQGYGGNAMHRVAVLVG